MRKNPLFSTYRQGENRVTSSMLAVFERIDLSLLQELLAGASGETSLQMVTFTNQPPGKGASVPDGRISARFSYWFEVKTARNALHLEQLREHLSNLEASSGDERLFVMTPDLTEPELIRTIGDPRVVWFNFRRLSDAIDDVLADPAGLVAEQARLLLHELKLLLEKDGLLRLDDVVVVAARIAYAMYLKHGVYRCQPGRTFSDTVTHLGFYTGGAIQPEIPAIHREDQVPFTAEEATRRRAGSAMDFRVANAIEALVAADSREQDARHQMFILSWHDDPATIRLERPIVNDSMASSDRPVAWTMGQRYTSRARLTAPGVTRTSQLEVS